MFKDMAGKKPSTSTISKCPEAAEELRFYLALCVAGRLQCSIPNFVRKRLRDHYRLDVQVRQTRNWINDIDDTARMLWRALQYGEDHVDLQDWIDRANKEADSWEK